MKAHFILLPALGLLAACSSQTALIETANRQTISEPQSAETLSAPQAAETITDGDASLTLAEPTPPDNLWRSLASNYRFTENSSHPKVTPHLNWLTGNQSYIDRITSRGERYLHHIIEEIEERGLPYELALLPAVESAYDPRAYSHSQAAGLWQFMPRTGDSFGLQRDWWVDQRRDVIASTDAALDYLQYLNKRFDGDWLLALAAYNAGEGTVKRAIKKNRRNNKKTDYWSLPLPKETKGYVPRLLALAKVIEKPAQYKVRLPATANQPYFDIVELSGPINLSKAAQMAGLPYETLELLNPSYKRHVTHPEGPHRVLLPTDNTASFATALAATPTTEWTPELQYRVRSGDSLSTLAKKYHLSIQQLKTYNQLSSNVLQIGQRLSIPGSGAPVDIPGLTYTVVSGDSLWRIAKKFKVSMADVQNWNGLSNKDLLKPGQQLQLGVRSSSRQQANRQVKKVTYKVRRGDSLSRIASKYYLSIKDIVKWNQISRNAYLKPGQRLTLFVDLTKI